MRILYDHQTFTLQEYGGISRYFFELIKRFNGIDDSCKVSVSLTNNSYLNPDTYLGVHSFLPNRKFKGKLKMMNFVNERNSLYKLGKGDFDVFHPTYYDTYFLDKIGKKPFVVTFLDMIHEKFSTQYSEITDGKLFMQKKTLLESANKIIAISECTKRDIIDIFNVSGDNIEVIYLGNSLHNTSTKDSPIVREPYILFVGNRSMYKNFLFFLKTVADLLVTNDIKLVCAGGGRFSEEENRAIADLGLTDKVIFKSFNNDRILSNLYSNALCFIFPTLYEGFGIPILESFACNCPIVCSTGGSLPEVAGDAVVYFSPDDQASMYKAIADVVSSESLRQSLREKGAERLKQFSWDKTYLQTVDLYKSIL